jgi:hypothetical protein
MILLLWVVKNVTLELFASLVKSILKAVDSLFAPQDTGATKLMKEVLYLVCGLARQVTMPLISLEQRLGMKHAQYVKLAISVKEAIVLKFLVNQATTAYNKLLEPHSIHAQLEPTNLYMEPLIPQAAHYVRLDSSALRVLHLLLPACLVTFAQLKA